MKKWMLLNQQSNSVGKLTPERVVSVLLENRGIKTKKERDEFLDPDIASITLESVGIDKKEYEKAVGRIEKAIQNKEQIVVYGDYDVDGITASAIVWEYLHEKGAKIMPYIPSRMEEGYGLSTKGISNIQLQIPNTKLIITVDNGIVAHEAVAFANEQGIDVIITDHHVEESSNKGLPDAFAIVHTTRLCGAGIAWLFTKQMANGKWKLETDSHLELAALGTVADLVPLQGANRTIVKFGIKKISNTQRPGLHSLFEEAACDASTIGVYHIGHIIAPRLNATGRIEHAIDSLRLLCTNDKKRAYELANKIGITNRERQSIMVLKE